MDKHTQTFNFSSNVISDTKGIWFIQIFSNTSFTILVSALSVYKQAAQTGLSNNTQRKEIQAQNQLGKKYFKSPCLISMHTSHLVDQNLSAPLKAQV